MTSLSSNTWQFWIDRGGTFTDIVARDPQGELRVEKLLSVAPGQYSDAAIAGIRKILDIPTGPITGVGSVRMGTTVATNALLEQQGEPTCLVTTEGFGDALEICYQNRPKLFDLAIQRPDPLYCDVVEVAERVLADGSVRQAPDLGAIREQLMAVRGRGITSMAIVLMHGYRFPAHEQEIASLALSLGYEQVSTSNECSNLVKFVSRGQTTVVDAYLSPVLFRYIRQFQRELPDADVAFMMSNGRLASSTNFRGKDSILSGPAGGLVAAARTATDAGNPNVVTFDMGGTSTDVAHYRHEDGWSHSLDSEVAGVRIQSPMLPIHTVAAGGGSICRFDGERFLVGPQSAGADPGPASYGRGGPLTITDCNLLLGNLSVDSFPPTCGPAYDEPISIEPAQRAAQEVAAQVQRATGKLLTVSEVAAGFLQVAVTNMANAIKVVSVRQGYDVQSYTLNCFGGAGGQLACAIADELGIDQVQVPALAGVLSALGMGLAQLGQQTQQSVEQPLGDVVLEPTFSALSQKITESLRDQGVGEIEITHTAWLRYSGADTAIPVPYIPGQDLAAEFTERHRQKFGFVQEEPVIVATIGVEGRERPQAISATPVQPSRDESSAVVQRQHLTQGEQVAGPALIVDALSTTVVGEGWTAAINERNDLLLTRTSPRARDEVSAGFVDPIMLEVFNNQFRAIAEQMGYSLQNTASSVNIKERLDYSCALFGPTGDLIANAPHIPIHLGSMSETVRDLIAREGDELQPGNVYATNSPTSGGTHLPDITVITPVFVDGKIAFFVGSRGHHTDIGGITPGSMPPFSKSLAEEGVELNALRIVDNSEFQEEIIVRALLEQPFPARQTDTNISDLRAQIAANQTGVQLLTELIDRHSLPVVHSYMEYVLANAAENVSRVIANLSNGSYATEMDDGTRLEVAVRVDKAERRLTVDLTGTSPQAPSNVNAPRSITRAVVLYVLRSLVPDDIPLNDGCLRPVDIILPPASAVDPAPGAAVVAGNVETSQQLTDILLAAFGVQAASQGTMNNLTFGTTTGQYYETICGGSGAGRSWTGASAVQTHMTNSHLTDPEILEQRFPVVLKAFSIRTGSGGTGQQLGGDGVVRTLEFREPANVSLLANRRSVAPFGLAGGSPALPGDQWIERANGSVDRVGALMSTELAPGDAVTVLTPGGGGFGLGSPGESS